jgi:hypothetical protein
MWVIGVWTPSGENFGIFVSGSIRKGSRIQRS